MKEKVKKKLSIVTIIALSAVIAFVGNSYWEYHKGVDKVLNYTIYLNLNATQQQLINLRNEFKKYENTQISPEEFQTILHSPARDYFMYADYARKFDHLNGQRDYVRYTDLIDYISILAGAELSAEEVKYHKNNLQEIIKLWAPLNFDLDDDYLKPTPELKQFFEESNSLAEEGLERT